MPPALRRPRREAWREWRADGYSFRRGCRARCTPPPALRESATLHFLTTPETPARRPGRSRGHQGARAREPALADSPGQGTPSPERGYRTLARGPTTDRSPFPLPKPPGCELDP